MSSPLPPGAGLVSPKSPSIDFTSPLDTSTLKDRSVLITGGASGIGLACVEKIASHGALVTVADVQDNAGQDAVKALTSKGYKVQYVHCDVTDYTSQVDAFKSAIRFGGGGIDVFVPNAGIIAQENLVDMAAATEPSLDTVPPEPGYSGGDVNLKGVYLGCYLALHYFRLPPPVGATPFKKSIVLVASAAGYLGYPNSTTYSLSKFGVRGIFYGIRDKASQSGVRVNLVAPFYVKTPMTDVLEGDSKASVHMLGFAPLENVVDAVLRFSANQELEGRSAVLSPQGSFDTEDDVYGSYGGVVMQKRMSAMMEEILAKMAPKENGAQENGVH
ncbi:NAD(P)-binding protein [Aaosphaeria arxii CBS 175.79]|uniref:NAD(P)-binding protein n=1 Tax=Aaosphaeria arxii CBS 175.79 TaxID=1450172 RepID=A0A6A5XT38_9PLEO|nr:NAD(P)-binding protein [Aaosphaeria arxii CBS 175.79]KAF2015414.1 NAD(P)-binding protein [Aaosphaeria arxii CBS 175.79]